MAHDADSRRVGRAAPGAATIVGVNRMSADERQAALEAFQAQIAAGSQGTQSLVESLLDDRRAEATAEDAASALELGLPGSGARERGAPETR